MSTPTANRLGPFPLAFGREPASAPAAAVGRRGASIRFRLLALVGAVAVPMLALASGAVWQSYANVREQQRRLLLDRAQAAAALIDRDFATAESALRVLGGLPELARGDLDGFDTEMRAAAGELGGVVIGLTRPDGVVALSTAGPPGQHPHWRAAGFVLEALRGDSATVSPFIDESEACSNCAGVALPIAGPSGARWVLTLYFPHPHFLADLGSLGLPAGWMVSLHDPDGRTIARSRNESRFLGGPPTPEMQEAMARAASGLLPDDRGTNEGVPSIAAFARAPQTGYSAVIAMPQAEFERPLRATLFRTGALALLVIAAGLGLALLVSRRIAGALHRLAGAPFATTRTGVREIDDLGAALAAAEQEVREGAERFRLLAQAMPDVLFMTNAEGQVTYINDRFQMIAGLTADEALGDGWFEAVHVDDRATVAAARRGAVTSGSPFEAEFRLCGRNGEPRWVLCRAVPWRDASGRVQCFVGFAVDVHDLRTMQTALVESEERLDLATSAADLGIWDLNLLDGTITLSERAKAVFGLPAGERVDFGMIRAATHPDDLPRAAAMARRALDPMLREQQPFDVRIVRPDGAIRWLLVHGKPLFATVEGESRAVRYVGTIQDVTERKRIEQELRANESRLRVSIDAGRMAVWEFDAKTDSLTAAPELGRVLGFPEGHVPGMAEVRARLGRRTHRRLRKTVSSAIARGDTFIELEGEYLWPDGTSHWMLVRAELILADGVFAGAIGVVMDITRHKNTEAELQRLNQELEQRVRHEVTAREAAQARAAHAERMQALGQIAGGIAHDFNNVLQAVTGGAALIQRRPGEAELVGRFARLITDAASRGTSITRRLLAFARRGDLRAEPLRAAELLEGLSEILVHTLGSGIDVRLDISLHMPPLLADRGQLETVLVNLATNARDAMPQGGSLTLSARPEVISATAPHRTGLGTGRYIAIAVSDTGTGMDAATLARAAEPFFTTKSRGEGTGLGLAMAKGFAEQSGGALMIDSVPGVGTTVTIWLPQAESSGQPGTGPGPLTDTRANARVLLVDDDGLVREALAAQLEVAGYAVATAQDGAEALSVLKSDEPVDCLVTDLSMPGMDGLALIREAQASRPRLPAVLVTGFAGHGTDIALTGASSGSFSLLHKPISGTVLADRISVLLEAAVPA